jgi:hypothetical protein
MAVRFVFNHSDDKRRIYLTSLLANQTDVRSVNTRNAIEDTIIPAGITDASSREDPAGKIVPLGWTPITGHISLIGRLHGSATQKLSVAATTLSRDTIKSIGTTR